jgi:hypothetical protein
LNRVSCLCPGWPRPQHIYLSFLHSRDERHIPPGPAICWDGVSLAFFPGLALTHYPPDLCLPSSWG